MNNKFLGITLAVFVGIAAGLCFLFSISAVTHQAVLPLSLELQNISSNIHLIQSQIAKQDNSEVVLDRLSAIERKLTAIEQRGGNLGGGGNAPAPQMPPPEDYNKVYDLKVDSSYIKGRKDAPVTIVEFTDFQCPFCGRFHAPLSETLKAYPNDVKYVIKNFPLPFHPNARPAAKAALAAGEQGKYYEMADALMENQQDLSDAKYVELAKKLGLNVKQFEKDLKEKDAKFEAAIKADEDLVNEVDVRGTPTFFINGKKTMARDVASFKREIDQILQNKGGQ